MRMLRCFSIILCVVICCCSFSEQADAGKQFKIVVNIPSRVLQLYDGSQVKKEYPIGIGTKENQTPLGQFKIVAKELNPIWIKPVKDDEAPMIIKSGPDNPLGYRWMEFEELYGIHGTNNPASIGGYVSNGCIRMLESDVEELYDMVALTTPVEIVYRRVLIKEGSDSHLNLYIYPDEYDIQPITAKEVYHKLAVYGVQDFVGLMQIHQALQKRDSTIFPLGKAFSLMIFGKKISVKAVQYGVDLYIPVVPVSTEAMVAITWDKEKKLLHSSYGSVAGHDKNDILYVKEKDLYELMHIYSSRYPDAQTVYLDYYQY